MPLSALDLPHNLKNLVLHFKYSPELVAVERNGIVPDRKDWKDIHLEETDKIEIVRFVQGG